MYVYVGRFTWEFYENKLRIPILPSYIPEVIRSMYISGLFDLGLKEDECMKMENNQRLQY